MAKSDLFENQAQVAPIKKKKTRRVTELIEIDTHDEYRRAFGVYQLCQCMMEKPLPGKSYHIITGGHVDLLAHVRWLQLHWKKVKHLFISAWAISGADILLLEEWIKSGSIGDAEILVGDIFPTKYKMEWKKMIDMYDAGMLKAIFKSTIHSKLLLVEADDGTKIVVESSANCNMNPRVEQSVVTVNDRLYDFYWSYLHELFEEEESRWSVRETLKLENDEYCDIDEGSPMLWEDEMG